MSELDSTRSETIIGFRKDRIGARLICLLNTIRIARKFGASGHYVWLSEPNGPYPELVDPRDFLASEYVDRHIKVINRAPDLGARRNVQAIAATTSAASFANMIEKGVSVECDSMSEIVRFMDEPPARVAQEIKRIASEIALSPQLKSALIEAQRRISMVGNGKPVAIHVRRGDILDGDPWSYSSWPAKYVPDEFFRAFIADHQGPIIAFSDTPAAVEHMKQGASRVVIVSELFEDKKLKPAEQDLLELLLMAGCDRVGAPLMSAFSRAAELVGNCKIVALPVHLNNSSRTFAHDALLERVVKAPDSFFAPGDLAQSLSYSIKHGINIGRAKVLVEKFSENVAFLERFPFLYPALAHAASTADMNGTARELSEAGLRNPKLRNRDRATCKQVLLTSKVKEVNYIRNIDVSSEFLTMSFRGREGEGPISAELGYKLCHVETHASLNLMFDAALAEIYAYIPKAAGHNGSKKANGSAALPPWTWRLDWCELLTSQSVMRDLTQFPSLEGKLAPMAAELEKVEVVLSCRKFLDEINSELLSKVGFAAAIMRLHGRYRRSFDLLEWIEKIAPNQALNHKRMADTCFSANNFKGGHKWLKSALDLSQNSSFLHLSAAIRLESQKDRQAIGYHLDRAAELCPGLQLVKIFRRRLSAERTM